VVVLAGEFAGQLGLVWKASRHELQVRIAGHDVVMSPADVRWVLRPKNKASGKWKDLSKIRVDVKAGSIVGDVRFREDDND